MKIAKVKHVPTLRIYQDSNLLSVCYLGDLSELGISFPDDPIVGAVIPREEMHGLNEEEKDKFESLLDDFKDIFALTSEDLGCAKDELHKVNVGDAQHISQRTYRRSPKENQVIGDEVRKLLSAGLLTPSKSPWASPLLLVKKRMEPIVWSLITGS